MKTVKRKSIGTHFSMCVQPAFIIGTNNEDGTHNFAPVTWVSATSLTLSFIRECITVLVIYSGKSVMFEQPSQTQISYSSSTYSAISSSLQFRILHNWFRV